MSDKNKKTKPSSIRRQEQRSGLPPQAESGWAEQTYPQTCAVCGKDSRGQKYCSQTCKDKDK